VYLDGQLLLAPERTEQANHKVGIVPPKQRSPVGRTLNNATTERPTTTWKDAKSAILPDTNKHDIGVAQTGI